MKNHAIIVRITATLAVFLFVGAVCANADQNSADNGNGGFAASAAFKVESDSPTSSRPINPLIYGNFTEFVGHQIEGMWGQMLFNRSFEAVPPYEGIYWSVLELRGPNDYNSGLSWRHSGYEENKWFAYNPSGRRDVTLMSDYAFYHGRSGGNTSGDSTGPWGIGQDGLHLKAGTAHRFRGFLAHDYSKPGSEKRKIAVKLVAENDESRVIDSAEFEVGSQFTECKAVLKNAAFTGRAGLRVEAKWKGGLTADGFELYPSDAVKGWRKDVVDALRQVHPTILRFPGGCFASFYNWRDAVGPRDDRIPLPNHFWGGLNDNDVGTDEYLDLCEMLQCEPMLCVNLMTGTAQLAADWVEYCNGSPESAMGKQRAANGHPEPRKVTYWELDNETGRKFGLEQYAKKVVEFSRAMKAVDPSIKLVVVGYDQSGADWNRLLELCGQHVELVCDRDPSEAAFARDVPVLSAHRQKTNRPIEMCNTEWPAPLDPPPGAKDAADMLKESIRARWQQWYAAMNAAVVFHRYWRHADWMSLSNFNGLVNQHGPNSVEASKSGAWVSASGRVLGFFATSPAAWPVKISPIQRDGRIHAAAAWSKTKDLLVISLVNTDKLARVQVTLGPSDRGWKIESTRGIAGPSLRARNTEVEPDAIRSSPPKAHLAGDVLTVEAPAYSVCEVILDGQTTRHQQ